MKRLMLFLAFLPVGTGLVAQAPYLPPAQLEPLVARIALYPDPLLAQVLAGATYYNQIPDAARWADHHRGQPPDQIAAAITAERVPFDPAVQALLPLPQVLNMMARDMFWTQRLGDAFLSQPNDVMDAVQRERRLSYEYGYLRTGPRVIVRNGPFIEILPAGEGIYYVPVYDPAIVYYRPRPGFFVGGAINFGVGFSFGLAFRPWGWGVSRFGWGEHRVFVNNAPWGRTYANRTVYVHPFNDARVYHSSTFVERGRPAAVVERGRPASVVERGRPAVAAAPAPRAEQRRVQASGHQAEPAHQAAPGHQQSPAHQPEQKKGEGREKEHRP